MIETSEKQALYYILETPQKELGICRATNMFFENSKRVYILTDTVGHAESLDRMLWTFKQASFIPHDIVDEYTGDRDVPVILSTMELTGEQRDVLVIAKHITAEQTHFLNRFSVVVDFAEKYDDRLLMESRERYKLMKELGFEMITKNSLPA